MYFCRKNNVSYILVSNHLFNWWFIISPPKGYCYCSPQRAVSQAPLLATAIKRYYSNLLFSIPLLALLYTFERLPL